MCTPRTGPSRRIDVEVVGGAGVLVAAREAEVVLAAAEVAEPRQVVDEQEQLGTVGLRPPGAAATSAATSARIAADVAPAADLDAVRQDRGDAGRARPRWDDLPGVPSSTKKRAPERTVSGAGRRELGREAQEGRGRDPERRLVVLADDQQVVAPLAAEEGRRSGP